MQDAAETEREIDFIARRLACPRGGRILDVCCGHGRHSRGLARRGFAVTGADLSAPALRIAQAESRTGDGVRWVRADMRALPFRRAFDGAVIWFSAIAVVDTDQEAETTLHGMAQALEPSGRLMIQQINHAWLMREFRERAWFPIPGGGRVVEHRRFDAATGRNLIDIELTTTDGPQSRAIHHMRIYTLVELVRMLQRVGLTVIETWGDVLGSPYLLDSRNLIVVARK